MRSANSTGMRAEEVNSLVSFKYVVALTLVLAAFIVTSPVFAAEVAPDAVVKSIAQEVVAAAKSDKELLAGDPRRFAEFAETRVVPHFDFKRMTQSAMARNWRLATVEQREQLTREFKTLLLGTYSRALAGYRDQAIAFRPMRADQSRPEVTVRSEVSQPGAPPTVIDYDLEKSTDGWKIFDVKVGGASLVVTYRDTFAEEVRNGGIDGLIASLVNKNRANEARYRTVKS